MGFEKELAYYRRLYEEQLSILEDVRQLDGFEDFLLRKSFSKLQHSASNGPVILLNASKRSCDALILTRDDVTLVPLLNMTISLATKLSRLTQRLLSPSGVRSEDLVSVIEQIRKDGYHYKIRAIDRGETEESHFQLLLKILWHYVVHPVILHLKLEKTETPKRIWWCPTGPFAFLPIHAAGIYVGEKTESVSNYCISSYSSTLQDLLVPPTSPQQAFKMLAVIQPEIRNDPKLSLPGTLEELRRIKCRIPHNKSLTTLVSTEATTSVEDVISQLPSTTFAHFGCHGSQNFDRPLDSALLLGGGDLKISDIIKCPTPNASLAYLSACETAKGDVKNPDEAMHIAATMIFAGFRGAVGTMWQIHDEDAPNVADAFYRHLFRRGPDINPDPREAAEALHLAVRELHANSMVTFRRWVPFIHLGV